MNAPVTLTQRQLSDFLLRVATSRPVFIWGPPGIGKSSLVEQFAASAGLPCVSLLGSQLAPENIIGVPQIVDGKSRFCPPAMIARSEPYCMSDALHEYGDAITDQELRLVAFGCLSPHHAGQFAAYIKQLRGKYKLAAILKGEIRWPDKPEDRDLLYFLAQSFRARLIKDLPVEREAMGSDQKDLAHRAKALMRELAALSLEMAQMVVAKQDDDQVPSWFLLDLVRDLPRLVKDKDQ